MDKYRISELSKTLGVSSCLLKHYEKFGIVNPIKDDDNNYRYYHLPQFHRLIESKKYKNIGYSIKDIARVLGEYDNEELNSSIQEQISCLHQEIERIQLQIKFAKRLHEVSQECDRELNKWCVKDLPTTYILKQTNNLEIVKENTSILEEENLIDFLPLAESALFISKENILSEEVNYNWCLSIDEKYKNEFNLYLDDRFIKIDSHKAFIKYIKIESPYMENEILINKIKTLIEDYPIDINGDILVYVLKCTHENDRSVHYLKVTIPVE